MRKILNIIILFSANLMFSSCIFKPINLDNIYSNINKEVFISSEDIKIKNGGTFSITEGVGGGAIVINIYNINSKEREMFRVKKITENETFDNKKSKINYTDFVDEVIYYIKPNENEEYLSEFEHEIIISDVKQGSYILSVTVVMAAKNYPLEVSKDFETQFVVIN